jgi:transcriptional regulator with XRE-family HTH domain
MTDIGQRVLRVREALNLSQTAFAERMRYGRQHVSSVERGKTPAGKRFLEQLRLLEREVAIRSASVGNTMTDIQPLNRGVARIATGSVERPPAEVMPPPHHVDPPFLREEKGTHPTQKEYAEAVHIIGKLLDRDPEGFRQVLKYMKFIDQEK